MQFKEEQKFTHLLFWLIMLAFYALPVLVFMNKGIEDSFLTFLIITAINLFAFTIKLSTQIDEAGIKMYFFPLLKKSISWTDIKAVKVIDYGFAGGWGIRFFSNYGTVYNIKGTKGVLVELKKGKTFVIGTQKEEELKSVLNNLGKISGQ
jgi:hypothetical protein